MIHKHVQEYNAVVDDSSVWVGTGSQVRCLSFVSIIALLFCCYQAMVPPRKNELIEKLLCTIQHEGSSNSDGRPRATRARAALPELALVPLEAV